MKINVDKTNMIAISAAISFVPECYIEAGEDEVVRSGQDNIKILGFTFSTRPTVNAHIEETIKKCRRRYWILRHLKNYGFDESELVMVYKSQVRSVLEYCSVVYHSMLTADQAEALERCQTQALKCIFGYAGESQRTLRQKAGLETLEVRRLAAVDRFTDKCLAGRFEDWFPKADRSRNTRRGKIYREDFARCDRLRNSPLFFMRRRLNQRMIESV